MRIYSKQICGARWGERGGDRRGGRDREEGHCKYSDHTAFSTPHLATGALTLASQWPGAPIVPVYPCKWKHSQLSDSVSGVARHRGHQCMLRDKSTLQLAVQLAST